jgi:hypothetical protein
MICELFSAPRMRRAHDAPHPDKATNGKRGPSCQPIARSAVAEPLSLQRARVLGTRSACTPSCAAAMDIHSPA